MTTGSYSRTSADGQSVQQKTWTGADGKTVENPYSVDMRNIQKTKCKYWSVLWYAGKELSRTRLPSADYCYFDSTLPVLAPTANLDLEALNKIATAIRGHDFNMAVFGAELGQTLELLRNTSSAVLNMIRHVRNGDWKRALESVRFVPGSQAAKKFRKKVESQDFSGALLAIRYGWQPLLQDLYEAMKAFEGRTKDRGLVFYSTKSFTQLAEVGLNPASYPMPGQQTVSIKYKVILSEKTSTARNLGLLDPSSVLWEKLPWSFVVDWFIPIGNYLSSLSFLGSLDAKSVKTVFQETTVAIMNASMWKGNLPPVGNDWLESMGFVGRRVVMVRTVGPIVVPKPSFKPLSKAFSLTHLENAAALLHQLMSGANPQRFAGRH